MNFIVDICILIFTWTVKSRLFARSLRLILVLCRTTVRYRYNMVEFLSNLHNRHPIARPWGRDKECLLWAQNPIYILPLPLQCYLRYHKIFGCVITELDCILCISFWVTSLGLGWIIYLAQRQCMNHEYTRFRHCTVFSNTCTLCAINSPPTYSWRGFITISTGIIPINSRAA